MYSGLPVRRDREVRAAGGTSVRYWGGACSGPRAENSIGNRGRNGVLVVSPASDLLDAVGPMTAPIGSLGMQDEIAGTSPPQGVRLDETSGAVVVQLDKQVVGCSEPHGLKGDPRTPSGNGWRR